MNSRKKLRQVSLLSGVCCVSLASPIALSQVVTIPTVPVGYANNAPDVAHNDFGSVGYEYNIGTYDVTSSQYCAFLNAVAASDPYGIYHPAMAGTTDGNPGIIQSGSPGSYTYSVIDGRGNNPVTDVSFWNATRFANWLDNGEPIGAEGSGTTETGTYDLYDTAMDKQLPSLIGYPAKDGQTQSQADNNSVVRSSTASWAVTSENEWYKAAYFDPTRSPPTWIGAFWYFPDRTDTSQIAQAQLNTNSSDSSPVGSYPYPSYSGTYDQGGDVYQWNESIVGGNNNRGMRGGAFDDGNDVGRAADFESSEQQPWEALSDTGFRVVQLNPLSSGGLLDVANRTVVLSNQPANAMANLTAQLKTGYNNGTWTGTSGITSSTAAADTTHLTAVGILINDTGANTGSSTGTPLFTTIGGQSTSDGDIILQYTYYGDANLSGNVDGSDYSLIDNGYLNHLTGWYSGDFNYDGVVDGSDYTLIDNTFNNQGASLAAVAANTTAQIAGDSTAVPEPGAIGLLGIAMLSLRRRPR